MPEASGHNHTDTEGGAGAGQPAGRAGYSRIAEEQEVQEGVGPEEVDEGPAQAPACCRENGEAGEEQQDGAKEGDLPPLRSLGQDEIGQDGASRGATGTIPQSPRSAACGPPGTGGTAG